MPKKKQKSRAKVFLLLKSGELIEVLKKEGKYYICENTQFRINSEQISEVKEVSENADG